jgi:hypothetical protein
MWLATVALLLAAVLVSGAQPISARFAADRGAREEPAR